MAYLKPQSPIKYKEDHIYPLTTIDQIIMDDGNRLSGVGVILDKPNEFEEGSAIGINADSLGGKSADEFLTTEEMDAQFIKANLEDAVFGEVAMSHADLADKAGKADKAIEADNATKLENKTINELFAMMFEVEHPVGSLYLSMSETDNPNTKWNVFGITCGWELVKDMFLLGAGGSYELEITGGEVEHTLTVDEMPSHTHTTRLNTGVTMGNVSGVHTFVHQSSANDPTDATGGSQPHNNMPPYIATNIWKRIS